jgi:hypothetical protein
MFRVQVRVQLLPSCKQDYRSKVRGLSESIKEHMRKASQGETGYVGEREKGCEVESLGDNGSGPDVLPLLQVHVVDRGRVV